MRTRVAVFSLAALLIAAAAVVYAQDVLSAKSGMINWTQGKVLLDDKELDLQPAQFPEVKEKSVLSTEEGLAEVVLTPGVFLRIAENSGFRMISNRLVDTRLDVLSGSAIIEAVEVAPNAPLTVLWKESTITIAKAGLYRIDSTPGRLKVMAGSATVQSGGQSVTVGSGKMLLLGATLAMAEKFDTDAMDSFDRWSKRRAEALAMANISAANRARRGTGRGSVYGGYPDPCAPNPMIINNLGTWTYNPNYGAITYVPCVGLLHSAYGVPYYSPQKVYQNFYARPVQVIPPSMGGGGGGYTPTMSTSSGNSSVVSSSAPVSSAPAAASSVSSSTAASSGSSSVGSTGGGGGRGR